MRVVLVSRIEIPARVRGVWRELCRHIGIIGAECKAFASLGYRSRLNFALRGPGPPRFEELRFREMRWVAHIDTRQPMRPRMQCARAERIILCVRPTCLLSPPCFS